MLVNKKTAYIFTSLNEDPTPLKKSFFQKFKKKKILKKENILLKQLDIKTIEKYSPHKCYFFNLDLENVDENFIKEIESSDIDRFCIFSFYPSFSERQVEIANFFNTNFNKDLIDKFFWIKSYSHYKPFFSFYKKSIEKILKKNNLEEKETSLFFLTKKEEFNNLYNFEVASFSKNIIKNFPYIVGKKNYFNKFLDIKEELDKKILIPDRKNIILINSSSLLETKLYKDRKSTRLNSSHIPLSRMPSSA